jgi:transposase-like protein
MKAAAAGVKHPRHFPIRRSTGTARFHLSADAVTLSVEEVVLWSKRQCVEFLAKARWGSIKTMACPHCGTVSDHYFRPKELRWKCKGCDSTFSVTSGTVFADHKLPLQRLLIGALNWLNGAAGLPALQNRRNLKASYNAAFTLQHKFREGLSRGFNVGLLTGTVEADGMDVLGRRYREKRNLPQVRPQPKAKIPEHLLKPKGGELQGPPAPIKASKKARQPEDRRILLVFRQRGVVKGKGAVRTRVASALFESGGAVTAFARKHLCSDVHLVTDEDPAYDKLGATLRCHDSVKHSETYSDENGVNQNQAESINARMRRAVEGVYLKVSEKYLRDYAAEIAWREDTRRISSGTRLSGLFGVVLGVGLSQWWRGFTHGRHRKHEPLIEGDREAKRSGPKKGQHPLDPAAWRMPK